MRAYIIRRLMYIIPTLLLVTVMVFVMIRLMPGDMIDALLAQFQDVVLNRPALEHTLGLDKPIYVQYGRWLGFLPETDGRFAGILQGNIAWSYWRGEPM